MKEFSLNAFFYVINFTDPCPSQKISWNKMAKYEGSFTPDNDLDIQYDVWRYEDCREVCEREPRCRAVKFSQERGICVLSDGSLKEDKDAGTYQGYPGWEYHWFSCVEGQGHHTVCQNSGRVWGFYIYT